MDFDTSMTTHEETLILSPNYNDQGLIPVIVQDKIDQSILMMAWMNDEALAKTRETGLVHFWSRSKNALWLKGEQSGALLHVQEIRIDCDQDCLLITVLPAQQEHICHTGRQTCFYRRVLKNGSLESL